MIIRHEEVRIFGNILTITGYFILLHKNPLIGVLMKVIGCFCIFYSYFFLKLWDVMFVMSLFLTIDISYAITIMMAHKNHE